MEQFTIVLSPDRNAGGYSVTIPAMPGAITEGDTRELALAAAAEVMALWLESAHQHGEQAILETPELIAAQVASVIEDRDAEGWDRTIETTVIRPAIAVA
jgi:antitoxin HicB